MSMVGTTGQRWDLSLLVAREGHGSASGPADSSPATPPRRRRRGCFGRGEAAVFVAGSERLQHGIQSAGCSQARKALAAGGSHGPSRVPRRVRTGGRSCWSPGLRADRRASISRKAREPLTGVLTAPSGGSGARVCLRWHHSTALATMASGLIRVST